MKEYDLICIGTGSVLSVVEAMIQHNPKSKVAIIDKDEPGGAKSRRPQGAES